MATPKEQLVAWLEDQVGYVANADKTNPYSMYMDSIHYYNGPKNGFDWCDVFADCAFVKCFGEDAALAMTYQTKGGGGAGCWISAAWYRDAGAWSDTPEVGAQIFFGAIGDEYHTGVVTRVTASEITTVEGNTGYNLGYPGGAVLEQTYSRDSGKIAGYGIPDWDLVEEEEVTDEQIEKIARRCAEYVFGEADKKKNLNMYNATHWGYEYAKQNSGILQRIAKKLGA